MSRTREIDVWLDSEDIRLFLSRERNTAVFSTIKDPGDIKAKIIIEPPERKVTIMESQFDEAWKLSATAETKAVHDSYLNLKEKLFGGTNE